MPCPDVRSPPRARRQLWRPGESRPPPLGVSGRPPGPEGHGQREGTELRPSAAWLGLGWASAPAAPRRQALPPLCAHSWAWAQRLRGWGWGRHLPFNKPSRWFRCSGVWAAGALTLRQEAGSGFWAVGPTPGSSRGRRSALWAAIRRGREELRGLEAAGPPRPPVLRSGSWAWGSRDYGDSKTCQGGPGEEARVGVRPHLDVLRACRTRLSLLGKRGGRSYGHCPRFQHTSAVASRGEGEGRCSGPYPDVPCLPGPRAKDGRCMAGCCPRPGLGLGQESRRGLLPRGCRFRGHEAENLKKMAPAPRERALPRGSPGPPPTQLHPTPRGPREPSGELTPHQRTKFGHQTHRCVKIGHNWRKPRGTDNRGFKGQILVPNVGHGSDEKTARAAAQRLPEVPRVPLRELEARLRRHTSQGPRPPEPPVPARLRSEEDQQTAYVRVILVLIKP
ncbi:unnamed protein product [Nyctereutes procyonoides]|uniref:(raccoon dog) hypothetical protein n=1 Tax=Nyctereutes procyonoides TaxID=34880 RepID=A0A811Y1N3_NYCPR|nr:unnamed protein product [Nyctereutes procyonoides]